MLTPTKKLKYAQIVEGKEKALAASDLSAYNYFLELEVALFASENETVKQTIKEVPKEMKPDALESK